MQAAKKATILGGGWQFARKRRTALMYSFKVLMADPHYTMNESV